MAGIILPVPADLLKYALGKTTPQVQIDADAGGKTLYQGWAGPNVLVTDPSWIVTKYVYAGLSPNVPSHYSTLTGVIWNLRSIYTFP